MGRCALLAIVVLLVLVSPASAISGYQPLPPADAEIAVIALHRRFLVEHREARLGDAARSCRDLLGLMPSSPVAHYNFACVRARQGGLDLAFAELHLAVAHGWDDLAQTATDPDLAGLHGDSRWPHLLERIAALHPPRTTRAGGLVRYEGTCSLGLTYRLVRPEADDGAPPARLVVWLHPTGESGLDLIEPLAPLFTSRGLALLVVTDKGWDGWSPEDQRRMVNTLRWLANVPGVTPDRPILFGYSAGGQAALELWHRHPEWFGGLVISAAYPVDLSVYPHELRLLRTANNPAVRQVPILVFVGATDSHWPSTWTDASDRWAGSGVPLTVHVVRGKGHTWLFGSTQLRQLELWLDRLLR